MIYMAYRFCDFLVKSGANFKHVKSLAATAVGNEIKWGFQSVKYMIRLLFRGDCAGGIVERTLEKYERWEQ